MNATAKRIVILTDLTQRAQHAVDTGIAMAQQVGGVAHVVHVKEDISQPYFSVIEEARNKAITEYEQGIREQAGGDAPECHFVAVEGQPAPDTLLYARDLDAALIVVPPLAYNLTSGNAPAFGSVAHRIARKTDRPVLFARTSVAAPARALVMTDFSEHSEAGMRALLDVVDDKCEIHVLHCAELPAFAVASETFAVPHFDFGTMEESIRTRAQKEMDAFLAKFDLGSRPVTTHIKLGIPVEIATHLIHQNKIELAAVGTHGRNALISILLGSVAEGLLDLAPCNVLIAPPPGRTFDPH